jgi:hypothetical protein
MFVNSRGRNHIVDELDYNGFLSVIVNWQNIVVRYFNLEFNLRRFVLLHGTLLGLNTLRLWASI